MHNAHTEVPKTFLGGRPRWLQLRNLGSIEKDCRDFIADLAYIWFYRNKEGLFRCPIMIQFWPPDADPRKVGGTVFGNVPFVSSTTPVQEGKTM